MPRQSLPDPEKSCKACGAQLTRKRINGRLEDRAVFLRRVFCNRACMSVGMAKEVCRSLSHSRAKAAATAKPACEACGREGRLHVHHVDENPSNNAPSNLRTLCPSCHRKSHSRNFKADGVTPMPCEHCVRPSVKLGLCATHLTRLRRHGHPLAKKRKTASGWVLEVPSHG